MDTDGDRQRPWLGLKPFSTETQHLFFGRSREIRELYQRVRDHPLTVLYGQSGRGKTSLLGAGLIPRLRAEGFRPRSVRLRYGRDDPSLCAQVIAALRSCADYPADATSASASQTLWELAHHLPSVPSDLVHAPPVLIFDQFEEAFTLAEGEAGKRDRRGEVRDLFERLAELVENRPPAAIGERLTRQRELAEEYDFTPSPVRIVITLREDYLAQLEEYSASMPSMMRNRQSLHELDGPSALEAVVQPGRVGGGELVSEEVGRRIVCFVAKRKPDTPLAQIEAVPPLLSLVCFELNEARLQAGASCVTAAQVEEHSQNILQAFYERSFAELPPAARAFVEDRLLTRGGYRNSVALDDAIELLADEGVENPLDVLDRLVAGRVLNIEERGGIQRIEITHDVLAPLAIRSRDVRHEKMRTQRAEAEDRRARTERNRSRRNMLVGAMTLVAIFVAWNSWRLAENAQRDASLYKRAEARRLLGDPATFHSALDVLATSFEDGIEERIGSMPWLARLFDQPPRLLAREGLGRQLLGFPGSSVLLAEIRVDDARTVARFSPDGDLIATASGNAARIWNGRDGTPVTAPLQHAARVNDIAFGADGTWIATAADDHAVRLWDVATGRERPRPLLHPDRAALVRVSPDGNNLATAAGNLVRLWDAATGQNVGAAEMMLSSDVVAIAFSADGTRIVASTAEGEIRQWDAIDGTPRASLAMPSDSKKSRRRGEAEPAIQVRDEAAKGPWFDLSPDGLRIVLSSPHESIVRVKELASGIELARIDGRGKVDAPVFSADGRWVATSGIESAVVSTTVRGDFVRHIPAYDGAVRGIRFGRDGRRIAITMGSGTVGILDGIADDEPVRLVHPAGVTSVDLSRDGRRVVTTSADKIVRLWSASPVTATELRLPHASWVTSAKFSLDGRRIATASSDAVARVWDARTGMPLMPPLRHEGRVVAVEFSPDATRLLTAGSDATARLWDIGRGAVVAKMLHAAPVTSACFSADGKKIATGSQDGSVRLWNAETGESLGAPLMHPQPVTFVSFSPVGRGLLTGASNTVTVWDDSGKAKQTFRHSNDVALATFSPDGSRIATASPATASAGGWAIRIWNAESGAESAPTMQHDGPVNALRFSPDGMRLVSASQDATARIWDVRTGTQIAAPLQHKETVQDAGFSPDGQRIVTASWDDTVRLWNASTGQPASEPLNLGADVNSARFSPDGRSVVIGADDNAARIWMPATYEGVTSTSMVGLLRLFVDCAPGMNYDDVARCRGVAPSTEAVAASIDRMDDSLGTRGRLRYHLLGDARFHPALAGSDYADDFQALRRALSDQSDLLDYWWMTTGSAEFGAGWALAIAYHNDPEQAKLLPAVIEQLRRQPLSEYARQDLRQVDFHLAALGRLRIGAADQVLWHSATSLPVAELPPVAGAAAPATKFAPPAAAMDAEPLLGASHRPFIEASGSETVDAIVDILFEHTPTDAERAEYEKVLEPLSTSNPVAAYVLARLIEDDPDRSLSLLRFSARAGVLPAANAIGYGYHYGEFSPEPDNARAAKWLQPVCAASHPYACHLMASIRSAEAQHALAVEYYRQAIRLGDPEGSSNYNLYWRIEFGYGTARDTAEAARLLQAAADRGDHDAQFEYAVRIEHGGKGAADVAGAMPWYAAAATRGHPAAAYRLGQLYELGLGDRADPAAAAGWYRLAAVRGHVAAHYALLRQIAETPALRDAADNIALAQALIRRIAHQVATASGQPHAEELQWIAGEMHVLAKTTGLSSGVWPGAQCASEHDGECDVPGLCPVGSDVADCPAEAGAPVCSWESDGVCDVPGRCPAGTDAIDCDVEEAGCEFENDGMCDVPSHCPIGTDRNDCNGTDAQAMCSYENDGECDVPTLCPVGTDMADCTAAVAAGCKYENDGMCDVPLLCPTGTDTADCGTSECEFDKDGVCDVPEMCALGTDQDDCGSQ